jgi:hypothetical protein
MRVDEKSRTMGHRRRWLGLVLLLAPLLAGCQGAILGDWRLIDAIPNRQVFAIDNASFQRDGTYKAMTTIDGKTTDDAGTYDFDGFKLHLRPKAGGQRTYTVQVHLDRLEILDGKRHAVLQKGKKGA